jgi:DNA-binding transcriptional ArsR family regulator
METVLATGLLDVSEPAGQLTKPGVLPLACVAKNGYSAHAGPNKGCAVTQPVDISDPTIAKAFAHPLRIQILALLEARAASPRQLSTELGTSLPTTSYHVRRLATMGLVKLVKRRQKRGSIEHFYTATVRPTIYDEAWADTPRLVRQALVGGKLAEVGKQVVAAAAAGGFDRDDIHLTRTRLRLTAGGWKAVSEALLDALERIDGIAASDRASLEDEVDAELCDATTVMMLFESPPPASFDESHAGWREEPDELEDVAPVARGE